MNSERKKLNTALFKYLVELEWQQHVYRSLSSHAGHAGIFGTPCSRIRQA
jgi:hypothetical protein